MYHCATGPMLHHLGMGMYGMIVVRPPHPAQEVFLVQSRFGLAKVKGGYLLAHTETMQSGTPGHGGLQRQKLPLRTGSIQVGVSGPSGSSSWMPDHRSSVAFHGVGDLHSV